MTVKDVVVIGVPVLRAVHVGTPGGPRGRPRARGRADEYLRDNMPEGMKLRSEPYGSTWRHRNAAGTSGATGESRRGLEYVHRLGPLPVEQLLDYTDWYTERWVPSIWTTRSPRWSRSTAASG